MQNDSSTQTTASASGTESLTKELANQIRNARAAYNVKFQEQNTIMGEYTRLISTGSMAQLLVIEEKFHAVEAEAKARATRLFTLQDRLIAALQAELWALHVQQEELRTQIAEEKKRKDARSRQATYFASMCFHSLD